MAAFYGDAMALPLVERRPGWVSFDAGGLLLALHAIPTEIAARITITTPPEPRSGNPLKLVFEATDVRATRGALEAAGAVMFEPRDEASCDGLDPEGNVFQIVRAMQRHRATP